MAHPYTTLHKRETGYPGASYDALEALWQGLITAAKWGWKAIRSIPRPKNFHARMILLAEAFVAAQGYLLWPSSANTLPTNRENDGFRYLDL